MLLEGYIEFQNEVPVSMECLGREYPLMIANFSGFLATPLKIDDFSREEETMRLQSPKQGNAIYKDNFNWGTVHNWPEAYSSIKACKILFYDVDEQLFEETGNIIVSQLKNWRSILIDNISLALRKDYRGTRRAITYSSYGFGEFGLFQDNYRIENRFTPLEFKVIKIPVIFENTLIFDVNELQQVISDTSEGKELLLPFHFLFDAERAKYESNNRKAVLDAATSVEVCFSQLISQNLHYDEDLNRYLSKKNNSLRMKRELLKTLKIKLPFKENEYVYGLDMIRNKVIHGGYNPSKDEVSIGYEIAKNTLYSLLSN